jgi:hypothetical protein
MLETTHKADWGAIVARAMGLFVLLIGVLFAAALCNASPRSDNSVPTTFEPHSTPAESICHLSRFVGIGQQTEDHQKNHASDSEAPFVCRFARCPGFNRAASGRIALPIRQANLQSKFLLGRA